jgi:hypothetical protein
MRSALVLALLGLLVAVPAVSEAAGLELAGYFGTVRSSYHETLQLDLAGLGLPGGVVAPSSQALELDARGGVALSGAATLYLADGVGLELRIDTADLDLQTTGTTFRVRVDFPSPLPDAVGDLELGSGPLDMERVRPLSLNLKLRTPGALRVALSGGVSYLPSLRVASAQAVRLRARELGGQTVDIELARVGLRADAVPEQERSGRLGVNAGAGLQLRLARPLWIVAEARGFLFRRHQLIWRRGQGALSSLEKTLADELERRLEPVDFNPTFWQATAGVAVAF